MEIAIILSHTQLAENIGFIARNMGNFGFYDLRLISPRDGWPQQKAFDVAKSIGQKVLENVTIFQNLESAVSDINFLYATTIRERYMQKDVTTIKNLENDLKILENEKIEQKIGILFGPENNGLSNEEVSFANKILTIPTQNSSSLNIALSVGIVCFELSNIKFEIKTSQEREAANGSDMSFLFSTLRQKILFPDSNRNEAVLQNLKNIFTRCNLTKQEVGTLIGLIKNGKID